MAEGSIKHVLDVSIPIDKFTPVFKCSCGKEFEYWADSQTHLQQHSECWARALDNYEKEKNKSRKTQ